MSWTVNEIRQKFLEFFESKGHKVEASAPMVVKNDPTLMFTNAGMNQFKDVFLGNNTPQEKRVTNSQKCLRVSGKHNDLEEVGVDTYHHTMFEMLGNWSFGDYFKKEAIGWAWELLTEVYKLDKDRLYVTVFEGDKEDGTEPDIEAETIWSSYIAEDRILRCDKKDNFWEMGEMGPCGPCSEIHIDLRSEEERKKVDGKLLVNQDHPLVIEIWNLVFIQFNRDASGKLSNLPSQHVDTGMGLERLAMALQKKESNYDTDVFIPLISELEKLAGKKYELSDSKSDVSFRVIADHIRAVSFSIADGQLPSNTGAGYVIRRILRRAVRYGYSFLGIEKAFIHQLVPVLIQQIGDHFVELREQKDLIVSVVREEEESFLRTLSKGIVRLEALLEEGNKITGEQAFELYDTFGFPIDLTQLIGVEHGAEVDMIGFEKELKKQKDRSRKSNEIRRDDWTLVNPNMDQTFIGYDKLSCSSEIIKVRKIESKGKEFFQIVLSKVPFYPEGGGQVGDKGWIVQGDEKIPVIDTKKENELIINTVTTIAIDIEKTVCAEVNGTARKLAQANHSATHLLHMELRKLLGNHVEQKGSYVSADYLRFDFSHFQKVSNAEVEQIENNVNNLIFQNIKLAEYRSATMDEANKAGAMMLFGEKYGDKVRMIQFGESVELCGGTHVSQTSEIRLFIIKSESSVAAGIRRIEAITSTKAMEYLNARSEELEQIKDVLQSNKPIKGIELLLKKNAELELKIDAIEKADAIELKKRIVSQLDGNTDRIGNCFVETNLSAQVVKDILFQLKAERKNAVVGVFSIGDEKLTVSLMVGEEAIASSNLRANEGIKLIASTIRGGGGGQPFFATAGGKNLEGIPQAIQMLSDWVIGEK